MNTISKDFDKVCEDLLVTGKDTGTLCVDIFNECVDTVSKWYDDVYKFCTTVTKE